MTLDEAFDAMKNRKRVYIEGASDKFLITNIIHNELVDLVDNEQQNFNTNVICGDLVLVNEYIKYDILEKDMLRLSIQNANNSEMNFNNSGILLDLFDKVKSRHSLSVEELIDICSWLNQDINYYLNPYQLIK